MLIPLLPFGQSCCPCPPKSVPELVRCISRCCWRAGDMHQTGQPAACSCLRSRERSTRRPSASELIPWDASRALAGGPPRLTFPSCIRTAGRMAGLHPVRVRGWVAQRGQAGGPAAGAPVPRRASAASALKAQGSFCPEPSP